MIDLSDIEINQFQLNHLLSEYEKNAFKYLLKNGVFCSYCNDFCTQGITDYKIYLDRFNDIKVVGHCCSCANEVTRIMEFGENESFFRKAIQFRNTHEILIEN
jgi:5-methylcytosine-specific restriction endonuclease McrA